MKVVCLCCVCWVWCNVSRVVLCRVLDVLCVYGGVLLVVWILRVEFSGMCDVSIMYVVCGV